MDFGISGALYPRARSYLKSLPDVSAPHAECLMTADFLQLLWPDVAPIVDEASFPEALRVRLSTPLKSGAWIPTTSMVLCAALLRDRVLRDDKQYATYMFDRGCQLYERPMYKAMMFVLSPNLVVLPRRAWQSFLRGGFLRGRSVADVHHVQRLANFG